MIIIDVGNTVRNAFGFLHGVKEFKADDLRMRANKLTSESNGSLMRASPLAVYLSLIKDDDVLEKAVISDVSLTHASVIVQYSVTAYCIAIRELINGKGREKAYEAAK